jgi:thymidine kinase
MITLNQNISHTSFHLLIGQESHMAKLYFYYSAMNAGKSATLLQSNHNYRSNGMHTALFTPRLDDRYGQGQITSRIGLQASAHAFESDFDFLAHLKTEHEIKPIACILIDEAQFLKRTQVLQLTMVVDQLDIPVLCYGLRTDFRGEPFEGAQYLLAWSDIISEIKTICRSGRKAIMNARLDVDGNRVWDGSQVEIGHNYVSVSRKEFKLLRASGIEYTPPSTPKPTPK